VCYSSTKCELAKAMNRQTCYQEILLQKEGTIKSLEGQQQQQQQNGHCGGNKADEHKYDYYHFDYSKKVG